MDAIARRGHDHRKVFDAFVTFAACALAMQTREAEYLEEAKRWNKDELTLFTEAFSALVMEMEGEPFSDVLGVHYMDWALSQKGAQHGGEFHTPAALCEAIARITITVEGIEAAVNDHGHCSISEPACGAGAMILSIGKVLADAGRGDLIRKLRVVAIDVNRTACNMCFVNTSLWGIPCVVVHGNTLTLQTWGQWRNIHHIMPWLPLTMLPAQATGSIPPPSEPLALPAPALTTPEPVTEADEAPDPLSVGQLDLFSLV